MLLPYKFRVLAICLVVFCTACNSDSSSNTISSFSNEQSTDVDNNSGAGDGDGDQGHEEEDGQSDNGNLLPPIESLTAGEWLAGDLHLHSRHSHDSTLNPIAKIVNLAESVGLDYLAITDHDNHVDGDVANNTWADPEFHNSPLIMLYSAEWTTHRGHGNPFSATAYDHQRLYDARDDYDVRIGSLLEEMNIHLSANHPGGSDHFGFSYDLVDSIEVWASAIWATNASAVVIWDDMLKSGRHITARGGSDSHHGTPGPGELPTDSSYQSQGNNVGTPTTWVFAKDRSARAVVDALTNGRASISSTPYAPRVELTADLDGDGTADMMMGDNTMASGDPVTFKVELVGGPLALAPYSVKVVSGGSTFTELVILPGQTSVTFTDTPPADERKYYRVEITGPQALYPEVPSAPVLSGTMVALSNPIYFNFDPAY